MSTALVWWSADVGWLLAAPAADVKATVMTNTSNFI
jgi:hypothetical protein